MAFCSSMRAPVMRWPEPSSRIYPERDFLVGPWLKHKEEVKNSRENNTSADRRCIRHFPEGMIAGGKEHCHEVVDLQAALTSGLGGPLHNGIRTRRQLEARTSACVRRFFALLRRHSPRSFKCIRSLQVTSGQDIRFTGARR